MTPSAAKQWDDIEARTITLPATASTQRAIHEALGHLYDELAIARVDGDDESELPDELFARLEELYVATAETSVSQVELTYALENRDDRP